VLAADLRGHARSAAGETPSSIEAMADDVAFLCDSEGIVQAVVVGHSMGGLVALDPARRHPQLIRALVLVEKGQALAAELADTVTFALMPGEARADVEQRLRDFRAIRDVELALHVSVIGDTVAPFMAPPDTDPAALRAADSPAILPDDLVAAAEEIQRRREEIGFS
jgi:pimeloyl-ACP methyl ester carboxylesterase